jgi:peptide/nickel transport system substrate-binding protein
MVSELQDADPRQIGPYSTKINLQVMNDAVILPAVYSKVLLYRSPGLSNIYVSQYFGMYNYAVLGRS